MKNTILETFLVDSFTSEPFKGNPAGVCLTEHLLTEELMLKIAQEIGYSETAFVRKKENQTVFGIRFFSPVMEIPICGHATLAAAKVILSKLDTDQITFINIEGVRLDISKNECGLTMLLPMYDTTKADCPPQVISALGISEVLNVEHNQETNILLLEIASTKELVELTPNYEALYRAHDTINGVLVTARGDDAYDFHSRYFWPWSGTNEDPVTGGSHMFLTNYWSKRLGKLKMKSFQASQRTGAMEVEIVKSQKVAITADATIILSGTLQV